MPIETSNLSSSTIDEISAADPIPTTDGQTMKDPIPITDEQSMKVPTPSSDDQTTTDPIPTTDPQLASPLPSSKCNCLHLLCGSNPNSTPTATDNTTYNSNSREHALQLLEEMTADLERVKASTELLNYEERIKKYEDHVRDHGTRIRTQATKASEALVTLKKSVDACEERKLDPANQEKLRNLRKSVMKLKLEIAPKHQSLFDSESDPNKKKKANDSTHDKQETDSEENPDMPNLCKSVLLENSPAFKDFKALYEDGLNIEEKVCLLSFSVFKENEVIKKRFMLYWWIGEGFVRLAPGSESAEDLANGIFKKLMKLGFIEPFFEKRSREDLVNKCRMHPFVRAAVIILAKRAKFFDFDSEGKPTVSFSSSLRACLLEGNKLEDSIKKPENNKKKSEDSRKTEQEDSRNTARAVEESGETTGRKESQKKEDNSVEMEKVHMLFNFNQSILDFEKPELFSKMKNLNILCLGRWQTSPLHHIEVEETKFMEGLKKMKHLQFLSLQGISRIMELPDSISKLANLTILDIRACHSLEEIPGEIGSLQSLTHLDMSECYLVSNMPKELASLLELQVLKGFVVGEYEEKNSNSCSLEHLVELKKLRKLGIYTGRKDFPNKRELEYLNKFDALHKLRIVWGAESKKQSKDNAKVEKEAEGNSIREDKGKEDKRQGKGKLSVAVAKQENSSGISMDSGSQNLVKGGIGIQLENTGNTTGITTAVPAELPIQLEKLDLQCFPHKKAPDWLNASKMSNIKKLYIRGGILCDLGQFQRVKHTWEVEILRLKFLNEMIMDWRELRELFPNLIYLEKVKCRKLTLFPCDEQGVWKKRTDKS